MGGTSKGSLAFLISLSLLCVTARPAVAAVSLSVEMTGTPNPVAAGGLLTYEIEVTNNGDEVAQGLVITAGLPVRTTFFSASDGGALQGLDLVVWNIGTLAGAGAQKTVTLEVDVTFPAQSAASIFNAVAVEADPPATPGSDGTLTGIKPLAVDLSVQTQPAGCLGSRFRTYTIAFANGGVSAATGVELSVEIPEGTVLDSPDGGTAQCSGDASPCSQESECSLGQTCVVFWDIGTLESQELGVRVFEVRVEDPNITPDGTTLTSLASLTSGPESATDIVQTTVQDLPCPSLEKLDLSPGSVEPGGTIPYRITVTNVGRVAATNSLVRDPLPVGAIFPLGGADPGLCPGGNGPAGILGMDNIVRWDLGVLDPAEVVNVCLELDVDSEFVDPTLTNEVTFTDFQGDVVTDNVTTTVQTVAALKLTKDSQPSPVGVGEQVTYTIHFRNVADFTVTGVVITDDPNTDLTPFGCASLDPIATAACGGDVAAVDVGGVLTWDIGDVSPGQNADVCFVVNVDGCEGQLLRNFAHVTDDRGEESAAVARTPIVDPLAGGLRLFKEAPGQNKVQTGTDIIYTLRVQNLREQPFSNVTITDDLDQVTPAGALEFKSAASSECGGSGPDGSAQGNIVTWTFPTLPPGEETVCLRAKVSSTLSDKTAIRNTALVSDPNENSATDSLTTKVFVKSLRVRMLDNPDPVTRGERITYTIELDNLGTEELDDVTIKSRVPGGTTLVCVDGGQGFPGADCESGVEGVSILPKRDPSVKGRRVIWRLDAPMGGEFPENRKVLKMIVEITSKRKTIPARAKVKEFSFRTRSKARALTVVVAPD